MNTKKSMVGNALVPFRYFIMGWVVGIDTPNCGESLTYQGGFCSPDHRHESHHPTLYKSKEKAKSQARKYFNQFANFYAHDKMDIFYREYLYLTPNIKNAEGLTEVKPYYQVKKFYVRDILKTNSKTPKS